MIDTSTYLFHDFVGPGYHNPKYAVLSHTWGADELTYQDWLYIHDQSPRRWGWVRIDGEIDSLKSRGGYDKIIRASERAAADGYGWIWIDTICIDKTNLAELSETINSMYKIYSESTVCYIVLSDVQPCSTEEVAKVDSQFRKSRWFTRGWTLQELLAPKEARFFAEDWSYIDNRANMQDTISEITSIPTNLLNDHLESPYRSNAVSSIYGFAQRMSWASSRSTTRPEDRAYCLLGIFAVNIPLLYGEGGDSAFQRLQEEVIKRTADWSVFAWRGIVPEKEVQQRAAVVHYSINHNTGLDGDRTTEPPLDGLINMFYFMSPFAWRPNNFAGSNDIPRLIFSDLSLRMVHTNIGLEMDMRLINTMHPAFYFGILPYSDPNGLNHREEVHQREYWIPLMVSPTVGNQSPFLQAFGKRVERRGETAFFLHRSHFPTDVIFTKRLPLLPGGPEATTRHVYLQMRPSMEPLYASFSYAYSSFGSNARDHLVSPVIRSGCVASVILTFPGLSEDIEFLEFWPPRSTNDDRPLVHLSTLWNSSSISADENQQHQQLAIGGIFLRHRPTSRRAVILFAVNISQGDNSASRGICDAAILENETMTLVSLVARVKEWGGKAKAAIVDDPGRKQCMTLCEVKRNESDDVDLRLYMHDEMYKGARGYRNPDGSFKRWGYHYTAICRLVFSS
jgi:hypothetical protein